MTAMRWLAFTAKVKRVTGTLLAAAAVCGLAWGLAPPAHAQIQSGAPNALIMDGETGLVLFSKNGDEPMPPASMSKLMTLLMAFEAIDGGSIALDDEFSTSEDAWRRGGFASGSSTMCLQPNERVSMIDLVRGVVVLSGNDASIVIADGLSGSEAAFAQDMNRRAEEIGLTGSHFVNATGWPDDGHVMSARDLAVVARLLIAEHPELYEIFAEQEFDFCDESPANRFNRNPLLAVVEGADGLKTGHTNASGYGLVGAAERDGVRRIIVFNGMETAAARTREAERLMNAAFRDFRVANAFEPGAQVAQLPVVLGTQKTVSVTVQEPVTLGYHRRSASDARARLRYDGPLAAPIAKGDLIGVLIVEAPNGETVEAPVFADQDVAKLGLIDRAGAALVHMIRSSGGE